MCETNYHRVAGLLGNGSFLGLWLLCELSVWGAATGEVGACGRAYCLSLLDGLLDLSLGLLDSGLDLHHTSLAYFFETVRS